MDGRLLKPLQRGIIARFFALGALVLCLCVSSSVAAERAWAASSDSASATPAVQLAQASSTALVAEGSAPLEVSPMDADFTVSPSSVTLKSYSESRTVNILGYSSYTPSVESSDDDVVSVGDVVYSGGSYSFTLWKEGVGDATVTVYGSGGQAQVEVTCQPTSFKLSASHHTFAKSTAYTSEYWLGTYYEYGASHGPDNKIAKAKSSKPSVASVKVISSGDYKYAVITPKKAGKTTITVTDQYGQTQKFPVRVKSNYFKANLKSSTYAYSYYGKKRVNVSTKPKAKVTLNIGGHKYTKRANKNGAVSFKLPQVYRLDKSYKITAKTSKAKVTQTFKIRSDTSARIPTITSCKNYAHLTAYNVHKGDKITVESRGEKYTKKVLSTSSTYYETFYFRYTMRNYSSFHITVRNKYNQQLYSGYSTFTW